MDTDVRIDKVMLKSNTYTNGYHHPSYWVVKEIQDYGNMVNVVSEESKTKLELNYDLEALITSTFVSYRNS